MYTTTLFDELLNQFNFESNLAAINFGTPSVKHTDEKTTFELALPGFEKKDINVEIESRFLKITADVKDEDETTFKKSFSKRYKLGNNLDLENVKANMESGVLSITFGKAEPAKRVKVL
jgi:HSP20 family protein